MKILFILIFSLSLHAISLKLSDVAFLASKQTQKTVILPADLKSDLVVHLGEKSPDYLQFLKTYTKQLDYKMVDRSNIVTFVKTTSSQSFQSQSEPMLLPPPQLNNNSFGVVHEGRQVMSMPLQNGFDVNNSMAPIKLCNKFSTYQLKYVSSDDISSLMTLYDTKYKILDNSNTLVYCDDRNLSIDALLSSVDLPQNQIEIKVTVTEIDNKKLKDVGISPHLDFDFSLLSSKASLFTSDYTAKFYGSLSFLQNKGVTNIESSTTYLLTNRRAFSYSNVQTLAYLDSDYSTIQNATNPSTTVKKYQFKDIGYTINIKPAINDNDVDLDFDLKIEDVISNENQLPLTAGKKINTRFRAQKGDIVILSGISSKNTVESVDDMPLPFHIPIISDLLTHTKKSNGDKSLIISVEILK